MNAMDTIENPPADTRLPWPLRQSPTLARLRAALAAQRPGREAIEEVCDRLLAPVSTGAEAGDTTGSTA
ncbi:MAG: hypothetical protein WCJ87_07730 [Burkholderiales bacterium]